MFIADAHCDTLLALLNNKIEFKKNNLQVDYTKMKKASETGILQFFAVFESPSNPPEMARRNVEAMIRMFHDITEKYRINKILSKNDIKTKGLNGLLSLEGLYFMNGRINLLDSLYEEGVRCISLTWNQDNAFAGGITGESGEGLSRKGKNIVIKAQKKGILIDISHISDPGFWDVVEISKKPFLATHSNVRGICANKRNLDDSMLKALSAAGGVSGINMYSCFLSNDCTAGIDDVIKHIEYICALTGAEYIGFGSDFDGIDIEKSALSGHEAINNVLNRLLRMNYSEKDVINIASGNILRVLNNVLV